MKRFEKQPQTPDSPDSEEQAGRARASSFSLDELSSKLRFINDNISDGKLQPLIRPYSCELSDSFRFTSNVMRTASSKRVKTWNEKLDWSMQCYVNEGSTTRDDKGSIMTASIKSQLEIEEGSASQPAPSAASVVPYFKKLNLSMMCNVNDGSAVATPMKEQLDMSIDEESTSRPTSPAAIAPAVLLRKSPKLERKKFVIPDEILARRKRHLRPVNEDSGTPVKRQRDYQNMKDKICQLAPEYPSRAQKNSPFCKRVFLLLFTVFVVLISVFLYKSQGHKHSSDFASAVVELKKRIYGQDEAIRVLSDYLQLDAPRSRIIILVGGTGVGKSYTVEIVKKNFPRKYAVRQYFPPIAAVSMFNFPFVHPNLIILENLRERDLRDAVHFLKRHQETYKNQFATVLAVFNFEQMDDHLSRSINMQRSLHAIEISFADENVDVEIIPYNTLSEDTLQKCIMDATKEAGLMLTEKQLYLVKETLQINNAGCKGAYNKVQVIGRQERPIVYDFL